jgi:hypothetical protein
MPHDKRSIINLALLELGQTELPTLGLPSPHEREIVMAAQWDSCIRYVAERGYWNTFQKTESLTADPLATPSPGWTYVIYKPAGWYRTMWLKANHTDTTEIAYLDEGAVWFANYETVLCRWVDQEALADGYIPAWPETFVEAVAFKLAERCAKRLTGSDDARKEAERRFNKALSVAQSIDAMNQPYEDTGRSTGSWNGARRGNTNRRWQ